jgi:hypothetical protein
MGFYIQEFTVTGHGAFPLDMLRYDSCYPRTQDDVMQIERSLTDHGYQEAREVRLLRPVESKRNLPTTARWNSFRWPILIATLHTT